MSGPELGKAAWAWDLKVSGLAREAHSSGKGVRRAPVGGRSWRRGGAGPQRGRVSGGGGVHVSPTSVLHRGCEEPHGTSSCVFRGVLGTA